MATVRICQKCRQPLSPFAPAGLCANCLIESGTGQTAATLPSDAAAESSRLVGPGESQSAIRNPQSAIGRVRYFGDYELLEEIARGGMGVVYKARQLSLKRIVAVKMILSGQLASAAEVQRFRHEAEAAANFQHPNIVAIHEVGEHEGHHYFSMELVEGRDLVDLARDGPLPAKRAAAYVKSIAEAIHYAHQKGVLHRDLKPSNVLIDAKDQPRLTDFGLAKRLTDSPVLRSSTAEGGKLETPHSELTLSGQILGTPNYMPPEQARGRRADIGPHSDVYSLGGILFFLLSGRPPFVGENLEETLAQVLHSDPVSPRLLNPSVPRDLDTICLKCLEKDGRRRYASAQDLAEELGHFLNGEPIHARPVSQPEKVWRWCQRNPNLAGALGAMLLVFVAGFTGVVWQWRRAEHNATAEARERERAEHAVTRLEIERAESFFAADNSSRALASVARLLRRQPTNTVAAERLMSALSHRRFCLPVAPLRHGTPLISSLYPNGDTESALTGLIRLGGSLRAANFSQDGRRVVTASKDGTARLWDGRTGLSLCQPLKHEAQVMWAQFSGDGKCIVTASLDKTARIWDVESGQSKTPPLGHDGGVLYATFSSDSRTVVTASQDKTVRMWDADTGQLIRVITNKAAVYFAGYSPD